MGSLWQDGGWSPEKTLILGLPLAVYLQYAIDRSFKQHIVDWGS